MYEEFYGLKERPFTLTPDPKYFYMSDTHLEALEHLIFGINQGDGFVVIIGEVGTGKTTLSRILLERLGKRVATSLILNPFLDEAGLLRNILKDFGVKVDEDIDSKEKLLEILQDFLVEEVISKGRKAIVIIDEAQNLKLSVLEELRILSNLETDREKLLQIILFGQEELAEKLSLSKLRQLNERISIRYFLGPLKKSEIAPYIYFRLRVAGASPRLKFTRAAIRRIWKFSKGKPRLINMICDRALLAGFIQQKWTIDETLVKKAEKSIKGEGKKKIWKPRPWWKKLFSKNHEIISLREEDEFNL